MEQQWVRVTVHPGAGKAVLVSLGHDRFEAWVKTKPIEGQANEAVTQLLAKALHVSLSNIRLVKGHRGRQKVFTLVR